ncbi:STY0301 family protein [Snodgrassella alvi]|uniref:Secreted protein n=1 Tax=Snodgrassella alvi TaxID=1196083 RepID=A0A2N9X5T5_9NEIS|nr:hypothetical protein BHC54_08360 [Snodgrassella alvi]
MLLNKKKRAIVFTNLLLSLISICCHAQTPFISCPSTFSDGRKVYKLYNVNLYDGPICKKASLVPEIKNNKQIWIFDKLMDPTLVCLYDGTSSYIVFDVKGANYCEKTKSPVKAYCMP